MGRNWIRILKEMAGDVYGSVKPLVGTERSRKPVGVGASGDVTRQIDAVAEGVIVKYLERNRIPCTLIGEECGVRKIGESPEAYIIVDGIDGTTNAMRGIRFACTSIAVARRDRLDSIEAAVVMRLDDGGTYTAEKGGRAEYNGEKISPSEVRSLKEAVIAIDISRSPENIDRITPLMKTASHVRCLGSSALEICQVSSGQLDAYVDVRGKLRTTDLAAAILVLREAGGSILQPDGEELKNVPLTLVSRFSLIAAANRELFQEIASKITDRG
ncbi:MAG: inositol monophosphatase family protein [Candidatus Bathyarchaeia archaeon]